MKKGRRRSEKKKGVEGRRDTRNASQPPRTVHHLSFPYFARCLVLVLLPPGCRESVFPKRAVEGVKGLGMGCKTPPFQE